MKKVLTIAGSDCSGGAGIQADLKTFLAHGMYGMSVITALTAQNTTGVYGVVETDPEFVEKQIDCIFQDIVPDAVKIGMVSNLDIIHVIVKKIKEYQPKHVVVDPVMISTSGSRLLSPDAIEELIQSLLPLAHLITPNILEAECICGFSIRTEDDMVKAAISLKNSIPGSVLLKGGHMEDNANDLLIHNDLVYWFRGEKIDNPNSHGTGCTLSSAIASRLAESKTMIQSVELAKAYVTGALKSGLNIGSGSGPLNHGYALKSEHFM